MLELFNPASTANTLRLRYKEQSDMMFRGQILLTMKKRRTRRYNLLADIRVSHATSGGNYTIIAFLKVEYIISTK
jgi:hypothetical protein